MISAVVLVKNQADQLEECLKSLTWCDEIIVIDDESDDNSEEIAKKYGAKIFKHALSGDFSAQRNYALQKTKNEWVLFVDADEVVPKELAEEIYQQTSQFLTSVNGFFIKRKDFLWGRKLRFGDAGNTRILRMGRREKGKWEGRVHEVWKIIGETATFHHSLIHYPHPTVREFLAEVNSYSTLRAEELAEQQVKVSWIQIIGYPTGKFLFNYLIKLGFLDGTPGMISSLMMSFHSFLVRGKLWQLRKKRKKYDFGY